MFSSLRSTLKFGALATVVAGGLSVGLSGCNYQVKKNVGAGTGTVSKPADGSDSAAGGVSITFNDVETKVLGPYCVKCHEEFGKYSELMAANDLVIGNASQSDLFNRLKNNGGDMPKNAAMIPDEAAALLRDWINADAPETLPGPADAAPPTAPPAPIPEPAPEPVVVAPTFTDLEAKVFSQKCTMCHSDAKRVANISLETYDGLVNNSRLIAAGDPAQSGIYRSVTVAAGETEPYMPPKRAVASGKVQALTSQEQDALKAWIQAGAPQN